jgi:hypothetical protein
VCSINDALKGLLQLKGSPLRLTRINRENQFGKRIRGGNPTGLALLNCDASATGNVITSTTLSPKMLALIKKNIGMLGGAVLRNSLTGAKVMAEAMNKHSWAQSFSGKTHSAKWFLGAVAPLATVATAITAVTAFVASQLGDEGTAESASTVVLPMAIIAAGSGALHVGLRLVNSCLSHLANSADVVDVEAQAPTTVVVVNSTPAASVTAGGRLFPPPAKEEAGQQHSRLKIIDLDEESADKLAVASQVNTGPNIR